MKESYKSSDTGHVVINYAEIGPLLVSTVFLSHDHNLFGSKPHLFETNIFCEGDYDKYPHKVRTSTWGEAEKAHAEAVTIAEERLARAKEAVKLGGN